MIRYSLLCVFIVSVAACGEVQSSDRDGSPGADAALSDGGVGLDADVCDSVTCECTVDSECGAHEVCDTSGPGRECACAPRYADTGSGCEWAGAPDDPSFQDNTAWQTTGSAAILPTSPGNIAAGTAFLSPAAVCELATVSQTVTMPSYDRAEPLAIETTHRFQGGGSMFVTAGTGGSGTAALAINGQWIDLASQSTWQTDHHCLGDAAYGGDVTVAVSAAAKPFDCGGSPSVLIEIDHAEIVPDATCPTPGDVREGDFEGSTGWATTNAGSGTASIATSGGSSNSAAGRLTTTTQCSSASLTGLASLPSVGVSSPALQLWSNGTSGRALSLLVGNKTLTSLTGSGAPVTSRVCLPPGMLGWTQDLTASLPFEGGSCSIADVRSFVFDDVSIVSEPACGTDPYVVDGGFESAAAGTIIGPWTLTASTGRGDIQIIDSPSQAQTGNGVLEFSLKQECASASARTWISVPQPEGTNGPALQFSYKAPPNVETALFSTPGTGALPESNSWATEIVCLDADLAGRMQQVSFTLSTGGGTCANTFAEEFAWLDDVRAVTSTACPL